ncbi:MAG: hypothetical protein HFJ35_03035 [Clostridia bacterium]|nr:hypothetical protein [Clostridia bacterium]
MLKSKKMRFTPLVLLFLGLVIVFFNPTPTFADGFTTNSVAVSNVSQTVYTGPGTNYVISGSISYGERVYIMDKEPGMAWYRIVYNVNGSPAQKSGYVPTNTMDILTSYPKDANYSNGYQAYSGEDQAVSSGPTLDIVDGSIEKGEGITVFYSYTPINLPYRTAYYIEYSTASGPKRGYILESIHVCAKTAIARVNSNANLYYGTSSSSYAVAGTVFTNEYVTVLAKNDDWVYIEYNTNSGRKRGYFSQGYLYFFKTGFEYNDLYNYHYVPDTIEIGTRRNVYAGPTSAYPIIGYVENESVRCYLNVGYNDYRMIEYKTSSGLSKTGFIEIRN